jgi:hypothetical protein
MNKHIDYESDFSAWALHNAQLLREGKFAELDVEHLIEELEDMGNNRQELANRFIILIAHLLKWEYQPNNRSSSWNGSINEQRVRITRLIRNKPSLKPSLLHAIVDAYDDAVELASDDTGLAKSIFPTTCPYSLEQLLEKHFFPENR